MTINPETRRATKGPYPRGRPGLCFNHRFDDLVVAYEPGRYLLTFDRLRHASMVDLRSTAL